MSSPNKNIPLCKIGRMSFLCVVCAVFMLSIMLTACGSGSDDDDSSSGGETIVLDWENDQIIVEVTSGGDSENMLTTPVGSLNSDDTSQANWILTRLNIDTDNNGDIDDASVYEYDSSGYLTKKTTYLTVDVNGDPDGAPDEIVEYNVDNGMLDEIEYDTDGDGTVDKIVDYDYDSDDRIDDEEIYNSSSKAGDPDEMWQYDYKTDEGAFLKERYIGGSDDASEIIVYNSHGDIIKISADPNASGVFQSIIEIDNSYDYLDNIATTTTNFYIGDTEDTEVVTYIYSYNDTNGYLESYEADDSDASTVNPVSYFVWAED